MTLKQTTRLGAMLSLWRAVHKRTLRDLATEMGIGHATLMRIEQGREMDLATWRRIETWLLDYTRSPAIKATPPTSDALPSAPRA